jgi:mono/diheme cytochrome c family protein
MRKMMLAATLLAALAGCGDKGAAPPSGQSGSAGGDTAAAKTVEPDMATAKTIYDQRCVPCHGSTGAGDGPASASLNPKPRHFSDKEWQKSVSDSRIERTIKEGGAAVGLSAAMPGNPDLADKPAVLAGLRVIIRDFGK